MSCTHRAPDRYVEQVWDWWTGATELARRHYHDSRTADLAGMPSAHELAGRHVHLGKIKAVQTCCVGEPS